MTNSIGSVSPIGASTAPVITAPAAPATGSAPAATTALLQNPKVILDPAAGFITEYLSANGSQVISQTPSAITVAYLRLGLTADGLSKLPAFPAQTGSTVGTTA